MPFVPVSKFSKLVELKAPLGSVMFAKFKIRTLMKTRFEISCKRFY